MYEILYALNGVVTLLYEHIANSILGKPTVHTFVGANAPRDKVVTCCLPWKPAIQVSDGGV